LTVPSFDVHQHFLPPPLIEALRARAEAPRLVDAMLELGEGSFPFDQRDHDLERRLALLDRDGTDIAVVSLAPTMETEAYPVLRDAYHVGIRDVVSAAGGRLRALAAGACLDGFAGACVSAQAVMTGLGSLPDELARSDQVLFVHPGPPAPPPPGAPAWWAPVVDYTAQMQAAYFAWLADGVERHPDVHVVFAVLAGGAPIQLERLRSSGSDPGTARHPRIHLDTASFRSSALRLCLETLGPDQLVFGSDVPVIDGAPTLRALAEMGEATLAAARSENPGRLFP
jgi:hypothetical protein